MMQGGDDRYQQPPPAQGPLQDAQRGGRMSCLQANNTQSPSTETTVERRHVTEKSWRNSCDFWIHLRDSKTALIAVITSEFQRSRGVKIISSQRTLCPPTFASSYIVSKYGSPTKAQRCQTKINQVSQIKSWKAQR